MPKCKGCGIFFWGQEVPEHKCSPLQKMSLAKPPAQRLTDNGLSKLPPKVQEIVFEYLDEGSLETLATFCKKWQELSVPLLEKFVPVMQGQGSSQGALWKLIESNIDGAKRIELAVDQFTDMSVLKYILKKKIPIKLTLGTPNGQLEQLLAKAAIHNVNTFRKMHNKIWVIDREGVILGSPNVSFSGLGGANLESAILIRSPRVGRLFASYLELLRTPNPWGSPLWKQVSEALTLYNKEDHKLKLAFAPVIKITDFVAEHLAGASKIIIRQFLISKKMDDGDGQDILQILCSMAKQKVDIEIYLDQGAYETMPFVQKAALELLKAGCKVFTQKPVVVVNAQNEALQHDKLILATLHTGVLRTMIGSAGFTDNVIANVNAENFICTDVQSVYDDLMQHHKRTLLKDVATTSQWVLKQ